MTARTKPIRVVIIDDHPLVIAGARSLIEAAPDIECVGVANTGSAGLKLVEETDPDVIVLDVSLPDANGLMIAKQIAESGRRGHIVMMTLLQAPHLRRAGYPGRRQRCRPEEIGRAESSAGNPYRDAWGALP